LFFKRWCDGDMGYQVVNDVISFVYYSLLLALAQVSSHLSVSIDSMIFTRMKPFMTCPWE
jgi:hypothetical protein